MIGSQLRFPAISVPIGRSKDVEEDPDGSELLVGLEVLGISLGEEVLIGVAAGVEAACSKH